MLRSNPLVHVLGWGTRWHGFHDKVQGVLDYVAVRRLPDDDLLCFVDGFDSVLLTRDLDEISTKFATFDADIVFSRERTSPGPFTEYVRRRVFGNCNGIAMNSGMWAGTVDAARRLWGAMLDGEDDQVHATRWCRAYHHHASSQLTTNETKELPRVAIDTDCLMFYNFSKVDRLIPPNCEAGGRVSTPCDGEDDKNDKGATVSAHPSLPGRILVRPLPPSTPPLSVSSESKWNAPFAVSAPSSDDMNTLLYATGYTDLPDMRSRHHAYHAGIFFRQWAFRQLLPETLLVSFVILIVVGIVAWRTLRRTTG